MNLSRNNDLKPVPVYKDPKEGIPFSEIVVPSSMRSPLWKYFGFPAYANKEIITKTKIVCGICRAYIAYNKNTTNLSTHLNCKHPEVLEEIKSKRGKIRDRVQIVKPIKLKQHELPSTSKRFKESEEETFDDWLPEEESHVESTVMHKPQKKRAIYKPKFQMSNVYFESESMEKNSSLDDENMAIESNDQENDNQYIDTIEYSNEDYNMDDDRHETISVDLATDPNTDANRSKDEYLTEEFLAINEPNELIFHLNGEQSEKKIAILSKPPPKIANKLSMKRNKENSEQTEEMKQIKKFLIKDLVPPSIIDGSGFKELISFLSPNADIPSSYEVEQSIEKDFHLEDSRVKSAIKSTVNKRYYSLLFHKLGNSSMIEISMNSWLTGGSWFGSLDNQMFCITKDCANFILKFGDSLKNCSAFIVDFDLQFDESLVKDIPIVPTFSYVTKMAFEECMQLSAVQTAVKFNKTLQNKLNKSFTWLQKFDHLTQYINDRINSGNTQVIQVVVKCLEPLKTFLEALVFETTTYASIMKPLALQLINQYYVLDCNNDDNTGPETGDSGIAILEKDLKRTIVNVLQKNIFENRFLTMASFLDPRFQSLTTPDDLKSIFDEIEKDVQSDEIKSTEKTQEKLSKTKEKNVGLSSLFSNVASPPQTKTPKNRFDIEFRSYTQDVSLNMELCPLDWWAENDSLYPNIKQYVKKYFCVPSFVNNLHRLSFQEQEELENKYSRYADEINEKLIWMHLSDLRQRLIDS